MHGSREREREREGERSELWHTYFEMVTTALIEYNCSVKTTNYNNFMALSLSVQSWAVNLHTSWRAACRELYFIYAEIQRTLTHIRIHFLWVRERVNKNKREVGGKSLKVGCACRWTQLRVINLNYCAFCIWQRLKSTCSDFGQSGSQPRTCPWDRH